VYQRLRKVPSQLEVLFMDGLQLSMPSPLSQQYPHGTCGDGCKQKKEHWQQLM
jgi:hypothetical protein